MANKSFGTKQLDLTGASGSPIITSPSDLSINATTVAISTNISVGGYFSSNVNVGAGYSIGIGTTIPVAELEVKGDIGLSGSIVATGNTFTVKTSDSERLRITPLGLVGIGTDNPATPLHVESSTIPVTIRRTSDAGDFLYLRNKTNYSGVIGGDSGDLYFKTNGTSGSNERLRIGKAGEIGIAGTNYGTSGQVLTSGGADASVSWGDGSNVPVGGIILWSGLIASIPTNWALCNGSNGTPDLRNRFIVGTAVDNKQGPVNTAFPNGIVKLHPNNIPPHTHSAIIHNKDINHQHVGRTFSMNRNHRHRHSTFHCSMNDNNGHNWYAGGDDQRGCIWRQDSMHYTDTNHEHDFRTGWMDRNNQHTHAIKINNYGPGHGFDVRPYRQ